MKNFILFALLAVLFSSTGRAQTENKEIIIGCWEVRQVIFTKKFKGPEDAAMEAMGATVCFDKQGKFLNKNGETTIKGSYSLSENGRTIYQNSDDESASEIGVKNEDVPGEIIMLSQTELQVEAEGLILYFRRS